MPHNLFHTFHHFDMCFKYQSDKACLPRHPRNYTRDIHPGFSTVIYLNNRKKSRQIIQPIKKVFKSTQSSILLYLLLVQKLNFLRDTRQQWNKWGCRQIFRCCWSSRVCVVGVTGVQKSQVAETPGFQAAPDLQRSQGTEGEKGQELELPLLAISELQGGGVLCNGGMYFCKSPHNSKLALRFSSHGINEKYRGSSLACLNIQSLEGSFT